MSGLAEEIAEQVEFLNVLQAGMGESPASEAMDQAHEKAMKVIMDKIGTVRVQTDS